MSTKSAHLVAIAIGIEKYAFSSARWDLDGPALDAARFAAHLRDQGVPDANIHLHVAPLERNREEIQAICHGLPVLPADRSTLRTRLTSQLSRQPGRELIVFWGGHGLLDGVEQLLLYPDAHDQDMNGLPVEGLCTYLRSYLPHAMQKIIVDACALPPRPARKGGRPPVTADTLPHPSDPFRNPAAQERLTATGRGRAYNDDQERTGLFSRFVINQFKGAAGQIQSWPPALLDVYRSAVDHFNDLAKLSLPQQVPAIMTVTPADGIWHERRFDASSGENDEDSFARMIDLIQRLGDLSERTRRAAGRVTTGLARTGQDGTARDNFSAGLYVQRDCEEQLIAHLTDPGTRPMVVTGEPGAGKTSLLWGISGRLEREHSGDVTLLSASDFTNAPDAGECLETLIAAWFSRGPDPGRQQYLLIDTVDLLTSENDLERLTSTIRRAVAVNVAVLLTSRTADAKVLAEFWERGETSEVLPMAERRLGSYAENPPAKSAPTATSEFERAIVAHALFFLADAAASHKLVARMTQLVSRRHPAKELCLRPLTMRMLFDLYRDGGLPPVIDTTGLYQAYWEHRVRRDQRDGSDRIADSSEQAQVDLSGTARRIAWEMLRQGKVEVPLASITRSGSDDPLQAQIELLRKRGVVETPTGRVRFFHQTLFEFAAATELVEGHAALGLQVALTRAERRPHDYFLLSVVEQTWLLAWRSTPAQQAAIDLATDLLSRFADRQARHTAIPEHSDYSLQRVVLAVTVQAPAAPPDLYRALERVLPGIDKRELAHLLRLLPAQARGHDTIDEILLQAGLQPQGATWVQVLEALERLRLSDGQQTLETIETIGLIAFIPSRSKEQIAERRELLRLLARLLPYDPARVLPILRACLAQLGPASADYFCRFLDEMRAQRIHPDDTMIAWAEQHATELNLSIHGLRILHEMVYEAAEVIDHQALFAEFSELLARADGAPLTRARTAAILRIMPGAPPDLIQALREILESPDRIKAMAWWGNGALEPLLTHEDSFQDLACRWLAEGLPAESGRAEPHLAAQRANLVRRSLEHPEMPDSTLRNILEFALPALVPNVFGTTDELWERTDGLLSLLVRAAAAGVPSARSTWAAILVRDRVVTPKGRSLLIEQVLFAAGSALDWSDAAEAFIAFESTTELAHQTDPRTPESGLTDQILAPHARRLTELVTAGQHSSSSDQRRSAYRLWYHLVVMSVLPVPEWSVVRDDYRRRREPAIRDCLIAMAAHGVHTGRYPWQDVADLACQHDADGNTLRGPAHDSAWRVLVKLRAVWDSESTWPELVDLAMVEPIEKAVLAGLGSFLNPDHRRNGDPTLATKLAMVDDLAHRLNDAARKRVGHDLAKSWSRELTEMIARADAEQQIKLLRSFPEIHPDFAAAMALMLKPLRHPELKPVMHEVIEDQRLGERAKEKLREMLALLAKDRPDSSWWSLTADLQQAVSPSASAQ